jgi:hypothetical protein
MLTSTCTHLEQENAPGDLLGDLWLAELSRLLPELRERYPDLVAPSGDEKHRAGFVGSRLVRQVLGQDDQGRSC